nr:zinc ribbon domain-containing protein [Candidatus Wallbacteria bacterium]
MLNKKSVNIRITIPKLLPLIIAGLILVFTCGEALAGRCSSCGKIIDDSSVFCMYCGVKVSEKSVSLFDIKKARRGGELINAAARG